MQANVEAVRVAGLVTTLVSMAGDNRRMDSLPNSVGPRVRLLCGYCTHAKDVAEMYQWRVHLLPKIK